MNLSVTGSNNRPRARPQRGDSLLEFALVLPILLALCVGMINFGLALTAQNQLLFAAREGVHEAALYGNSSIGMQTAEQDIQSIAWVHPDVMVEGCGTFGDSCTVYMCAAYPIDIPFLFSATLNLTAAATALTERQTSDTCVEQPVPHSCSLPVPGSSTGKSPPPSSYCNLPQ